jgi:hypothetical protein
MATTPRHAGSKVVPHPPNLARAFRKLQDDVRSMRNRIRPETIQFIESSTSYGVNCASASAILTHYALIYRSGHKLYVDVVANAGSTSIVEALLTSPEVPVTGTAIKTPVSGGGIHNIRCTLAFPDAWQIGDPHLLYLQARRVSGPDTTTVQVLRAVQR